MDRRAFFREAFRKVVNKGLETLESFEKFTETKQRPPGSSPSEEQFKQLCSGCDACMAACPINIVMIENMELRYPVIYPEKGPCVHCEGYPCIASCPTGALTLEHGTELNNI